TDGDSCMVGSCIAGPAVDCTVPGDQCSAYSCNSTGPFDKACTSDFKPSGAPCEDGLYCTEEDGCDGFGGCSSGAAKDCSAAGDDCNGGLCDEDTESCIQTPLVDGTVCSDGDACTINETCQVGFCVAGGNLCGEHGISTFLPSNQTQSVWAANAMDGRHNVVWRNGNQVVVRAFDKDWSREWTESQVGSMAGMQVFAAKSFPDSSTEAGKTMVAYAHKTASSSGKSCYTRSSCTGNGSCCTSYNCCSQCYYSKTKYSWSRVRELRLQRLDALGKADGGPYVVFSDNGGVTYNCSSSYPGDTVGFTDVRVAPLLNGNTVVAFTFDGTERAVLVNSAGTTITNWTFSGADKGYDIVAFADSSFLIVKAQGTALKAQRYTQDANAQGTEFDVATAGAAVNRPAVGAQLVTGNYIVAWEQDIDGANNSIMAQVMKQDDSTLGGNFAVDESDLLHTVPRVGTFTNGSFTIAWNETDGAGDGVFARFYNKNGIVLSDAQQVNIGQSGAQRHHSAHGLDDGQLIVTWVDEGNGNKVFARKYNQLGEAQDDVKEAIVNTTTAGEQNNPSVSSAPNGSYVAVWEDGTLDGSSTGVAGAMYDADGTKLVSKSEFVVNETTDGAQKAPAVAVNALGKFAVAWDSFEDLISLEDVFVRLYDETGTAVSSQLKVNQYTDDSQQVPHIAWQGSSTFAVVWESFLQPDGASFDSMIRCFNAGGTAVKDEQIVNAQSTTGMQQRPRIAATTAGGGRYLVAWDSFGTDWDVRGKIFASGPCAPSGSSFTINTTLTKEQSHVDLAARSDGTFLVVWQSDSQDGSSFGIYGQVIDETGAMVGTETKLNIITANEQSRPRVTTLTGDNALVSWRTLGEDEDGFAIKSRRFDSALAPIGNDWIGNLFTAGDQIAPSMAPLPSGGYVLLWHGPGQDADGNAVVQRRFPEPQNAE
ncbi:MAG: hypothetical protein ACI9WU_001419, partial [Myxococcota bacterium]